MSENLTRRPVDPGRSGIGRVLFLVRPDLDDWPGGDTVQIRQTAEELKPLGVRVEIRAELPALESRRSDLLGQAAAHRPSDGGFI